MIAGDQSETIQFLAQPSTHGVEAEVERAHTHISELFLAGDEAFKLKRSVRLPYADFSSVEMRLAMCEGEVDLNRRTAPQLYRGVRRISRGPEMVAMRSKSVPPRRAAARVARARSAAAGGTPSIRSIRP